MAYVELPRSRHIHSRNQQHGDAADQRKAKQRQPALHQKHDGKNGAGEADEQEARRDEAQMRFGHAPVSTGIRMDEPIENRTQHL